MDNDKVLLMRYIYGETEVWGVPGGGVNSGETLIDALKRELDEELGVTIEVGDLLCVLETPSAGKVQHTVHCVFSGTVSGGSPKVNPEHTSALEAQWVEAKKLDGMVLYPPVNDIVQNLLQKAVDGSAAARYVGVRKRQWF